MVESRAFNIGKRPFPPLPKPITSLSFKGRSPLTPFLKKAIDEERILNK
jgi:hypothetical protein